MEIEIGNAVFYTLEETENQIEKIIASKKNLKP